MSGTGKKTGHVREGRRVTPAHQRDHKKASAGKPADKPDFDERDFMSTPKRKAAGPGSRRRRRLPPSSGMPSTPDVTPDLNNDADNNGQGK